MDVKKISNQLDSGSSTTHPIEDSSIARHYFTCLQGTKWYRTTIGSSTEGAWGFVDGGSSFLLNAPDVGTSDADKRISWPIGDYGYRCGTTTGLNFPTTDNWEKVFYHGNAADTTPTTGLM